MVAKAKARFARNVKDSPSKVERQRLTANSRERQRTQRLKSELDRLALLVPQMPNERHNKNQVLRLAARYIQFLSLMAYDDSFAARYASLTLPAAFYTWRMDQQTSTRWIMCHNRSNKTNISLPSSQGGTSSLSSFNPLSPLGCHSNMSDSTLVSLDHSTTTQLLSELLDSKSSSSSSSSSLSAYVTASSICNCEISSSDRLSSNHLSSGGW